MTEHDSGPRSGSDFIRTKIADDIAAGRHGGRVVTRFPPEPNGFLHIGHVKAICLNFGIAAENEGGECHLRFDDTNPETEDIAYVESIENDVKWLGFDWGEHLYFASDYFEHMYAYAEDLIRTGHAYIDSSSEEEIRDARGTVTQPGRPTASRDRAADENLNLFRRMRAGEFANGAHVLRAKIDLASNNMLMRDPVLYRIRHAAHYRTGDAWCIYPLYDFAHPIEDAIESITHSLCTLEFDNNRELYDWVVAHLPRDPSHRYAIPADSRPHQTEFARLALDYTVMSKRKLLQLVQEGLVSGWDDPRMPTVAGMRRRGMTPESLRAFAELVGIAKANSRVDIAKLEFAIREDLNKRVPRVLCVTDPLRVVITNLAEGDVEHLDAPYYPHDIPLEGSRTLPFSRELFIDREDFREEPPAGYNRLAPGREVRLRYAYIIRCDKIVKDDAGKIIELRCTYDPEGGKRSVKGTIQWVSAEQSLPCEVRLYDRLFKVADPDAEAAEREIDWKTLIDPQSLVIMPDARIEPAVRNDPAGTRYQFERVGYFTSDIIDSTADHLVFNRTVSLRESFVEGPAKASSGRPDRERAAKPKPDAVAVSKSHAKAHPKPARTPDLERRMHRYVDELKLTEIQADVITRDADIANLFDAAMAPAVAKVPATTVANWIVNELPRILRDRSLRDLAISGGAIATVLDLVERREISNASARDVMHQIAEKGGDVVAMVSRLNLRQDADTTDLEPVIRELMNEYADKVQQYRSGRTGLLGFFVGQVMAKSGGRANPQAVSELVGKSLQE